MDYLTKIQSGELKLRDLEKHLSPTEAARVRRAFVEQQRQVKLTQTAAMSFDAEIANRFNVENLIGATSIPLGITDALKVSGDYASGEFVLPLATTEKSLIAGISRGCKAITLAGGATVWIEKDLMTRAPVFQVDGLKAARALTELVTDRFTELQAIVAGISAHARLESCLPAIVGRQVYLRLAFSTGDAMGMNVVTRATDAIGRFLEQTLPAANFLSVSGNYCVDKKPSSLNQALGRGKTVHAECILDETILHNLLKTTPAAMAQIAYSKNLIGSAASGSLGFNAHFANVVAALFLATGQDPAHVVGGSQGFSLMEVLPDGRLHTSVTLPVLEVATVGGGTRLETQREALELLGCAGSGDPPGSHARKLAEIVAAAVLAGEISLLAAEAEHHLAEAHRVTAR